MEKAKGNIISLAYETIYCIRIQNYHEGSACVRRMLRKLQEEQDILKLLTDKESSLFISMRHLLEALEINDMILVADLLEEEFLPQIKMLVAYEEEQIEGNYSVEGTISGYHTVKHLPTGLYLHTNGNPMEEARILVEHCYDPQKEIYAVWGLGLGYHIKRLYEKARGAIEITVFEPDRELITLAKKEGILSEIPVNKLQIVEDRDGKAFSAFLAENTAGILMHFPSVKKIENSGIKEVMHRFFTSWNGTVQLKEELTINFRCNEKNCGKNVDELAYLFENKEVVIVAAGPSLDKRLEWLKAVREEKTVLAVGTVWKKLLDLGIKPDGVVVMDSKEGTFRQFDGVKNTDVPLLLDSTAYWEFGASYQGEKYIAYQYQCDEAEAAAREKGNRLYETGGSVTTLALEIALKLGAAAVYLVGVDMAYPKGISHAENTAERSLRDTTEMTEVKSVNGDTVLADTLFIGYRKWIEQKISKYPQIPFYNLSDCGAHIEGTQVLKEC